MATRSVFRRNSAIAAAILAGSLWYGPSQPAAGQQLRPARVSLSSLTAQGFEIKGLTGNQSGVIGTLVLQKDKEVFLCESKDLSIQPIAFECWPVK